MTFKQIQEKANTNNIGVFFRTSAPDARPKWRFYRYFAYDSATANVICGFKTLDELAEYVDSYIDYLHPKDEIGTMTYDEIKCTFDDLKLGVYIRRNAPDGRDEWKGYNYYLYESGTTACSRCFKTLKDVEDYLVKMKEED